MTNSTALLATASRATRSVRLERVLPAGIATVWTAFTDPAVLPAWFGPVLTGRPGPGQRYVLEGRGNHGDTIDCAVRVWDAPTVFEHTWCYIGESGDSVIRVELTEEDPEHTRVVLTHTDIVPDADPADYAAGWHMYTDNLEAHLAGRPGVGDSDARWMELLPAYAAIAG